MNAVRRQRSLRLAVRVTPDERRQLGRRAADCGLTVSEYLRRSALDSVPRRRRHQQDRDLVAVLARLSQQLGDVAQAGGGSTLRLDQVLRRIDRAVREVVDR
jgi:hypothetical protein